MSDPKPFASLSSGLLARKGAARPAMRPQGFGQSGAGLEDLGWNDMGFESPKATPAPRDDDHDAFGEEIAEHPRSSHKSGLSPVESPVHSQQAEIADRFSVQDDAEFDEDYDDTAELYDPEAVAAGDEFEDDEESDQDVADQDTAAEVVQFAEPGRKQPVFLPPAFNDAVAAEDVAQPAVAQVPAAAEDRSHPAVRAVVPIKAPRRAPKPRSAPGVNGKAAFTLRLDPSRHLKLRLACAVHGRSAQLLVTEALDQLLSSMPELEAMADRANHKG